MKILLIDNIDNELAELKQHLQQTHAQFGHVFGLNAAVSALAQHKFNVVFCASKIDHSDGNAVLEMVAKKFPAIVRILINGQDSSVKTAHMNFNAPLNCDDITSKLKALAANNSAITKDVIINTVAKIKTLPSPPKVYMQLNSVLKANNTDSKTIADIIAQDPALTAKVLQFVNNTFANSGKPMISISEAITKMGLDTLCCIVMTAELFTYNPKVSGFSIIEEQLHSLSTAKLAASLVRPELKQDALIAGLLHDIGKIVLFEINEKSTAIFFKHKNQHSDNIALENKIFSTDHSHVGAYLLHTWGFSYHIIEALILHHRPEKLRQKEFGIAQAVYLANTLIRQQDPDLEFVTHFKLEKVIEQLQQRASKFR